MVILTSCSSECSFLKRRYTKGYYHEGSIHTQVKNGTNSTETKADIIKKHEATTSREICNNSCDLVLEEKNESNQINTKIAELLDNTTHKSKTINQNAVTNLSVHLSQKNKVNHTLTKKQVNNIKPYCSDPGGSTGMYVIGSILGVLFSALLMFLFYMLVLGAFVGLFSGAFLGVIIVALIVLVVLAAIVIFINSD